MLINRRKFLRSSGQVGLGVAVSGPVHGLLSRATTAAQPGAVAGYGPLVDDPKGMLALPEGFTYRVVTQAGKTRLYSDHASPGIHDGAAAFAAPDGNVLVVLNHEVRGGPDDDGAVPHLRGYTWRDDAGGGCTVVKTTPGGELIWETVALAGTSTNCAGGVTPSPDGTVLFAGLQQPGTLFAITGPWSGSTDQQGSAGQPRPDKPGGATGVVAGEDVSESTEGTR